MRRRRSLWDAAPSAMLDCAREGLRTVQKFLRVGTSRSRKPAWRPLAPTAPGKPPRCAPYRHGPQRRRDPVRRRRWKASRRRIAGFGVAHVPEEHEQLHQSYRGGSLRVEATPPQQPDEDAQVHVHLQSSCAATASAGRRAVRRRAADAAIARALMMSPRLRARRAVVRLARRWSKPFRRSSSGRGGTAVHAAGEGGRGLHAEISHQLLLETVMVNQQRRSWQQSSAIPSLLDLSSNCIGSSNEYSSGLARAPFIISRSRW